MRELEHPSGEATVGNPKSGHVMKIQIEVEGDKIKDIRFQAMGCAAAIATSSMATEMAKGKTIEEAFFNAKQKVKTAYPHPYDWGAFVLNQG